MKIHRSEDGRWLRSFAPKNYQRYHRLIITVPTYLVVEKKKKTGKDNIRIFLGEFRSMLWLDKYIIGSYQISTKMKLLHTTPLCIFLSIFYQLYLFRYLLSS